MPLRARQSALCTVGLKRKELIGRPSSLNNQQSMDMVKKVFSSGMDARKYSLK
jgi:hypothetical protein